MAFSVRMEGQEFAFSLSGHIFQDRVAETTGTIIDDIDHDAAQAAEAQRLARALEYHRAGKWISSRMRRALELAGHDVSALGKCSSTVSPAPNVAWLGEKTLSQSSDDSTCSGDSNGAWSCVSIVTVRKVRFSSQADIVEVERFTVAEIIGSREHDTCWSDTASRRRDRFRIRVHSSHRCRQRACCHSGDGLCTGGGSLASEVVLSLLDVFSAWRIWQGIPATVPNAVMNRGRCWPRD